LCCLIAALFSLTANPYGLPVELVNVLRVVDEEQPQQDIDAQVSIFPDGILAHPAGRELLARHALDLAGGEGIVLEKSISTRFRLPIQH
jgi:hypothetical protein